LASTGGRHRERVNAIASTWRRQPQAYSALVIFARPRNRRNWRPASPSISPQAGIIETGLVSRAISVEHLGPASRDSGNARTPPMSFAHVHRAS
jgi:hypothetical protein